MRFQTHKVKMYFAVNKQNLTPNKKTAQIFVIDSMTLNALSRGLKLYVGQIIRESDSKDTFTAEHDLLRRE